MPRFFRRCRPVAVLVGIAICGLLAATANARADGPARIVSTSGSGISDGTSPARSTGSTSDEGGIGTFSTAPFSDGCVADVGGINHPSCTANDVRLTSIVEGTLIITEGCTGTPDHCLGGSNSGTACTSNAQCTGGGTCVDTVTFSATGQYQAGPQRYDVGLYIAIDGDPNGDGARFGHCTRFAFLNGETVALDSDNCGDVNANSTPAVPFGPVRIPCFDANNDGLVDINHCETWAQRSDEIICNGAEDVRAGTGSKCFCGLLQGACIAISDNSDCTRDVCQGTCQNSTGGGSQTICEDNTDCPVSGESCRGISLKHISDTTVECRPAAGDCDLPELCNADGTCPANAFKSSSVVCRAKNGDCDLAENCTGDSASCPADGVAAGGNSVECRASDGSSCDPAEYCDGVSKSCPGNVCLGNISHP
jgi:hypothetical protein